jgi:YVTN family beta-propeller protein
VSVPEAPGSQPGADVLMRVVNIADPANPQVTLLPARASGFHAHGYFQSGAYLYVGPHCLSGALTPCNGTWPHDVWGNSLRIGGAGTAIGDSVLRRADIESETGLLLGSYQKAGAQAPWGVNDFWSYNTVSGNAFLAVRRNNEWVYDWANGGAPVGPAVKASWDHLGLTGVTGFPFIMGNILIWASDQAGTGIATYDISDLSNPVLLDVLKEGNIGGYWPEIYGHYVFFPRRDGEGGPGSQAGFMVVDFSDPTNLRIAASRNLPGGNQYVTFQDEYAFMNRYKIDMRTFDVVLELATGLQPDGVTKIDASQFALPVGNLVVTGGYGSDGPGLAIWAHQAEPDTRAPFVAYHIPRPDQTNYPLALPITLSIPETLQTETIVNGVSLIVRPVGGSPIPIWHSFGQGKLLTVTPQQPLLADTTYEVVLTSGIQDAMGNGLEPYSFRFSTGGGLTGGNQPPVVTALSTTPAVGSPGVPVQFNWSGSDPDGDAVEYRVDVGDGSPRTSWSAGTSHSHSYAEAGHYQITVQARDVHGAVSARSQTLTVIETPAAPNSTASSMISLSASGDRVYTVNPDIDTVTAIDAASLVKLWEVGVGGHPLSVAVAANGNLWVACRDSDSVDVLSSVDGALIERISTGYGSGPVAAVPVPGGASILVSCEGDGSLRRFNATSRAQTASLLLGAWPRAIAVTEDGTRALVTRFISGQHFGSVYDVSLAGSMSLTRTIRLARDRSQDGPASSRGVPNYLAGVRIAPSGTHAWVVGKKDNTTRGTFMGPLMVPGQDTTVRAQLMLIDLTTNAEAVGLRLDLDNSDSPTAVGFSPFGDWAFITLQGNAQVAVVDVLDLMRQDTPGAIKRRLEVGLAPQGLVVDGPRGRVLTADFMSRTVTALDVAEFLATGNTNILSQTIGVVGRERLHPEVLLGKQIFYHASDPRMSAEGYISCATCHVGGGHDGQTWDFTNRGEGFRNTTDLRGRSGTRHGNVHWSGNFDEIQDFEIDIREFFGGRGFLSDAQYVSLFDSLGAPKAGASEELDALAAYVASLGVATLPRSPHRGSDGSASDAATRGQNIFLTNNCQSCHNPNSDYTDGLMHDVGTLRASSGNRLGGPLSAIRTPTLLGLHASAPYFHNGTAATLGDVFEATGGLLIQAEAAELLNGATANVVPWFPMKEWHQGAFVEVDNTRAIRFSNVHSSTAGSGHLEVRYNVRYGNTTIRVTVNGSATPIDVPVVQPVPANNPNYVPTEWRSVRIPITWQAGANTIQIQRNNGGALAIDDVLFATPDHLAAAAAHRPALTAGERADLIAYLLSLDPQNAPPPAVSVFRGGLVPSGSTDIVAVPTSPAVQTLVYTIHNDGASPLNLGWVHLVSAEPSLIAVANQPAPQVLPGESTTLAIEVDVSQGEVSGVISGWSDAGELGWTVVAQPGSMTSVGDSWMVF